MSSLRGEIMTFPLLCSHCLVQVLVCNKCSLKINFTKSKSPVNFQFLIFCSLSVSIIWASDFLKYILLYLFLQADLF